MILPLRMPAVSILLAAGAAILIAQQVSTPSQPSTASDSPSAAAVFKRYSGRVVKVEVTENGSAAKTSLGSGFYVDDAGTIITNYHVIAKIVNKPDQYHANIIDASGQHYAVTVAAVDVVNDLAMLRSTARPTDWFSLESPPLDHGERLYSMGHPRDLGLSVVEGTYNGLLEHTLYPKIHFTGAINQGMSGGPAMTSDGRTVGVNVSTMGDGIGFLVPIARAAELVGKTGMSAMTSTAAATGQLIKDVAQQIEAYQNVYLEGMFSEQSPSITLGRYTVPTKPAPFFKCWADVQKEQNLPYTVAVHQCSTDDAIFISDDQWSGVVEVDHELYRSKTLGSLQFASLLSEKFGPQRLYYWGSEEDVTDFECKTRNVANGSTKMRVAFCARGYKKLPALYDTVLRIATLGSSNSGIISTLKLSGVSFANAKTLSDRYLRSITWNR